MRWASRRGLLELDLLLGPFMDQRFAGLEPAMRAQYRELMLEEDQQILNWIMERDDTVPPALSAIVAAIRDNNRQQPPAGE
jgi:antitoxin CptB